MVSGVLWSAKLVLQTKTQKSHFCVRASMVVNHYIKLFLNWGQQTQRYFNVSSPSSLRENYTYQVKIDYAALWTTYFLMLICFV